MATVKKELKGMPICSACGTGEENTEMEIAEVRFPVFVEGKLESVSGEGMKCPKCGHERLVWIQYKNFRNKLLKRLSEADKENKKEYCFFCRYQICQPAYLRFFCGNSASSEFNKQPTTIHLDKCCECFESVFQNDVTGKK